MVTLAITVTINEQHALGQWFSTWGPRTPKWSANNFKGATGSARGLPKY